MKIIAKKGTAFEQTIKSMCEKMTAGITGAQDLVVKAAVERGGNTFLQEQHIYDIHDMLGTNRKYE